MSNAKPIFVMMVGLPASGKSTYAKELSTKINAEICSSDEIRKELCGDENSQDKNNEVFNVLHNRIKGYLRQNKNVIYDATNIHSKRRRSFLSELSNIPCIKKCVIMATPYEICCDRNCLRDRNVPYAVIKRMYMAWDTPYWFEGWDEIKVIENKDTDSKLPIDSWTSKYINYNQDNPHHTMTLGEHCSAVAAELKDDTLLYCAGLLHDCGKPFTKSFENSKGATTDVAHYYQHHCVGAYKSLFFDYPKNVDRLDVSVLVNLHMTPYFWERDKEYGEKTRCKYYNLWGKDLYKKIMKLHTADKNAH